MSIDVPDGYRHWPNDPAEDHLGPFFYQMQGGGHVLTRCHAQAHHCNTYGSVHGGVLMAFADYTLCLAAIESEADAVVTVSATCDFIAAARAGDVLDGEGELTRLGGSLAFTRAVLRSGDRVVMTASGVIKRLRA